MKIITSALTSLEAHIGPDQYENTLCLTRWTSSKHWHSVLDFLPSTESETSFMSLFSDARLNHFVLVSQIQSQIVSTNITEHIFAD